MKLKQFLKINFLVLGLVVVMMVMFRLKDKGLNENIQAVMGLNLSGESPSVTQEVTWCETRVSSLEMEGLRLFQEGLKWFMETDGKREADFVSVEKWFGRHCTLDVDPVTLEDLNLDQFNPLFTISFVKGPRQQILRSGDGVYLWGNQAFRSTELDEALRALADLPQRVLQ
ncbi:MAG: hypothetical protein KDD43_08075 [Bdellovibrionales bacterium]|nr:hypothetical protein [Bdellovibrionales bacterium]